MTQRPLISIGVPVLNGAVCLRECLENLRALDYPRLEFIVSDNASTDDTADICREFAEADPRFRIFRQDRTVPVQQNFQFVLDAAQGDYFSWHAHDDLYHPRFAAILADLLDSTPDASLAASSIRWSDVTSGRSKVRRAPATGGLRPAMRAAQQLSRFSVHWIYGLYRTDFIRDRMARFEREIGTETFHCDIIWVAQMVAESAVVTAPDILFHGRRVTGKTYDYAAHTPAQFRHSHDLALRLMSEAIDAAHYPAIWRPLLRALARRVVLRRVVPARFRRDRHLNAPRPDPVSGETS